MMQKTEPDREKEIEVNLKTAFAVVAFEARLMISNSISRELIHQIHSLVTDLALLLGPYKRHRFFTSLLSLLFPDLQNPFFHTPPSVSLRLFPSLNNQSAI